MLSIMIQCWRIISLFSIWINKAYRIVKGCKSHNLLIYTPISGKRGIRTLGTVTRTTVFETVPIDHSGIFP